MVVCIEIFAGSVSYAKANLPKVYPPDALYSVYGYSYALAWTSFVLFVLAGAALFICSRKEKSAEKDQPVVLGRL